MNNGTTGYTVEQDIPESSIPGTGAASLSITDPVTLSGGSGTVTVDCQTEWPSGAQVYATLTAIPVSTLN